MAESHRSGEGVVGVLSRARSLAVCIRNAFQYKVKLRYPSKKLAQICALLLRVARSRKRYRTSGHNTMTTRFAITPISNVRYHIAAARP